MVLPRFALVGVVASTIVLVAFRGAVALVGREFSDGWFGTGTEGAGDGGGGGTHVRSRHLFRERRRQQPFRAGESADDFQPIPAVNTPPQRAFPGDVAAWDWSFFGAGAGGGGSGGDVGSSGGDAGAHRAQGGGGAVYVVTTKDKADERLKLILRDLLGTLGMPREAITVLSSRRDGNGRRGCWRAHQRVASHALARGLERVLVFEDDAEPIARRFTPAALARVVDFLRFQLHWDVYYLATMVTSCKKSPLSPSGAGIRTAVDAGLPPARSGLGRSTAAILPFPGASRPGSPPGPPSPGSPPPGSPAAPHAQHTPPLSVPMSMSSFTTAAYAMNKHVLEQLSEQDYETASVDAGFFHLLPRTFGSHPMLVNQRDVPNGGGVSQFGKGGGKTNEFVAAATLERMGAFICGPDTRGSYLTFLVEFYTWPPNLLFALSMVVHDLREPGSAFLVVLAIGVVVAVALGCAAFAHTLPWSELGRSFVVGAAFAVTVGGFLFGFLFVRMIAWILIDLAAIVGAFAVAVLAAMGARGTLVPRTGEGERSCLRPRTAVVNKAL